MSRNYATTNDFYFNDNKVREIVEQEFEQLFVHIKHEIEGKIKQIDFSISQIKTDISKMESTIQGLQSREANCKSEQVEIIEVKLMAKINEIHHKVEEIKKYKEAEIERLGEEIRNRSIDRSYDRKQEKSPLFRKSTTAPSMDLNSILFGNESSKGLDKVSNLSNQKNEFEVIANVGPKPPLPINKSKNEKRKDVFTDYGEREDVYDQRSFELKEYETSKESHVNRNEEPTQYTQYEDPEHQESKLSENLNKNKNSFMRKKSLKRIGTIPEEEIEESMLSTN